MKSPGQRLRLFGLEDGAKPKQWIRCGTEPPTDNKEQEQALLAATFRNQTVVRLPALQCFSSPPVPLTTSISQKVPSHSSSLQTFETKRRCAGLVPETEESSRVRLSREWSSRRRNRGLTEINAERRSCKTAAAVHSSTQRVNRGTTSQQDATSSPTQSPQLC